MQQPNRSCHHAPSPRHFFKSQLKQLRLADAGFSGPIPPQLGNLSDLHTLDLANNYLTLNNLDWLSRLSSLRYLNMSGLNFSEVVNWPQSISKLSFLIELQLSSCNLSNIDHRSLAFINSSTSLQVLELSDNLLNSSIFYWIANVSSNLVQIGLKGDQIRGRIPDVFANMVSLVSLDLSFNKLEGGIPKSFQSLCSLESLDLSSNKFSDKLHNSVENLSCAKDTLFYLDLSRNMFWGRFPDDLTRFLSLSTLLISSNQLHGSLPESIGQLSSLEDLDLSWNSLTGVITQAHLFNLSRLWSWDVSYNPLSFNFSSHWQPPFQLEALIMSSCKVGPAFPKWILTQRQLSSLEISNAGISDSIPNKFWDLASTIVVLNLSMNQIHGKLPNLSSKKSSNFLIDLRSNDFSGPLPLLPAHISHVFLSKNMFSGPISSLCTANASQLYNLNLSENLLSGELPKCWMQFRALNSLNLAKNNFSGKIPSSLGYLKSLIVLQLNDNKFSGELPSLENCTTLAVIDLGANKLSGKIPAWVGQSLPNLIVLRLRSNEFSGSIPRTLCSLSAIRILDLSRNNISGALPHCLTNITALSLGVQGFSFASVFVQVVWKRVEIEFGGNLMYLRSIDISSNYLVGDIPENITSMTNLISLNLSRNDLTGKVPCNFGQLKMLESLDLSRNLLRGRIPASFSSLNFLSVLDISYNNLSGRIPLSTQLQSFDTSAYMGNVGLCGPPLLQQCPGDETAQDPGITRGQEDDGPMNLGFYVSIVLGFFTGFWGVCGTLLLKRSWRYGYFKFLTETKDWFHGAMAGYKAKMQTRWT